MALLPGGIPPCRGPHFVQHGAKRITIPVLCALIVKSWENVIQETQTLLETVVIKGNFCGFSVVIWDVLYLFVLR